eukprot:TRINITY_DN13612_c0_g2_i1.p1 TRINITY_DN13612_c0_g2~~TRINITY_DN13612_c0_g2_i1.p1  ORF type:complete len:500 (+),score=154.78 TRINITY_DN13612_c0_g2_i1:53-1552(+)
MAEVELAAAPGAAKASDSEDEEAGIDFQALAEAQQLAGELSAGTATGSGDAVVEERKKKRAGNKESQKRRKRQKRENDMQCVKQAGIVVPSLKDALIQVNKGSKTPIPSLKEALQEAALAAGRAESSASSQAPAQAPAEPAGNIAASAAEASESRATGSVASSAPPAPPTRPPPVPDRDVATYEDADALAAGPQGAVDSEKVAAALARVTKDSERRVRNAQAVNSRSVFITNLPFKATEEEIRKWLEPGGNIKDMKLNRDKATTRALGYGYVQFESTSAAEAAVKQCDKVELHGRVLRIAAVSAGEKFQFELPEDIKDDIRALIREAYEGKNISTIKDAWQKRHPGQKLDTTKWGFKNFSTAMKTVEGLKLEHHLEKTLTYLAFFDGSEAHAAFLQEKARKAAEPPSAPSAGEAKRAAAEADVLDQNRDKKRPKVSKEAEARASTEAESGEVARASAEVSSLAAPEPADYSAVCDGITTSAEEPHGQSAESGRSRCCCM